MPVTAIILAAGYGTRLSKDLEALPADHPFSKLKGLPKPLLPVYQEKPLIDQWIEDFKFAHSLKTSEKAFIQNVFVVSNHSFFPLFATWAAGHSIPADHVIDDGSSSNDDRLGAVADLALVLKLKEKEIGNNDVLVVAGDTLFSHDFQLSTFLETRESNSNNVVYYELQNLDEISKRGIIEIDRNGKVTNFLEKPLPSETHSRLACPAFYVFSNQSLPLINQFIEEKKDEPISKRDAPGLLVSWLKDKTPVLARKISGRFDIGNLSDYQETLGAMEGLIVTKAHARCGMVGNPSDGFFGKTISFSLSNYWAQVKIWETKALEILPNEVFDTAKFNSLAELSSKTQLTGYYGGNRLIRAACKRFFELASRRNLSLSKNFSICYNSNIPFAVGLAGSSAIVTAAFKGLMSFYNITLDDLQLSLSELPNVILAIEKEELGITAGLQDRVIQSFEGVVFMDFAKNLLETRGFGDYQPLDPQLLPTLYLAYQVKAGGDSGKIHSDVRKRWDSGEEFVVEGMKEFAKFTDQGKEALEQRNYSKLAQLIDLNFEQRRKLFTDRVLGEANLRMIELARSFGFAAGFTGSGGAINCLLKEEPSRKRKHEDNKTYGELELEREQTVKKAFAELGIHFERSRIHVKGKEARFIWEF